MPLSEKKKKKGHNSVEAAIKRVKSNDNDELELTDVGGAEGGVGDPQEQDQEA